MSRVSYRQDLEGKINVKIMSSPRNKNSNILSAEVNICLFTSCTVECVIQGRIQMFRHVQCTQCTQDYRNNVTVHIVQSCGSSTQFMYCMQIRVSSIHFFLIAAIPLCVVIM